jgi:SnoaL-like protein
MTTSDAEPGESTMPLTIDRHRMIRTIDERIAHTDSPRQRRNLEVLRRHMEGEIAADIDVLISTLSPDCEYRTYGAPEDLSPRGHDEVRAFYAARAELGQLFLEYVIEHLVVDDDAIVTDGVMTTILPGRSMREDMEGFCRLVTRLAIVWPFSPDGLLRGEHSLSSVIALEELAADDVPLELRAAGRSHV